MKTSVFVQWKVQTNPDHLHITHIIQNVLQFIEVGQIFVHTIHGICAHLHEIPKYNWLRLQSFHVQRLKIEGI